MIACFRVFRFGGLLTCARNSHASGSHWTATTPSPETYSSVTVRGSSWSKTPNARHTALDFSLAYCSFAVQSQTDHRRTYEFPSATRHSTPCWVKNLCPGTQTHWSSSPQTHSPATRKRDSGRLWCGKVDITKEATPSQTSRSKTKLQTQCGRCRFQYVRHSAVNLAGFLDPILKDWTVKEKMVGRQREIV